MKHIVYLYAHDTVTDWEPAYLLPELVTGRFFTTRITGISSVSEAEKASLVDDEKDEETERDEAKERLDIYLRERGYGSS